MTRTNFESKYIGLITEILSDGIKSENRTGTDAYKIEHGYIKIDSVEENFPMLKGKPVFPHMSLTEVLWFYQGRTDLKFLHDHNVHYWDEWALKDGTIGKSYGHQFRDFNGIDQVKNTIDVLINNPLSRKNIISLWNPKDLKDMSLEPCVDRYHFECTNLNHLDDVNDNYAVDLHVTQRSADTFLGVPYDFMNAGWILTVMCTFLNQHPKADAIYTPGDIHYTMDNVHIYENHLEQVQEYSDNCAKILEDMNKKRTWIEEPQIKFEDRTESFDEFLRMILNSWDGKKYSFYKVKKNWKNNFKQIKAPIAV